jgi:formyltetrahydrofolate deformylase
VSAAWGQEYVLTFSCPEKPGIVHAVSGFLVEHSANILASQQYGDAPGGRFFMRVHFAVPPGAQLTGLRDDVARVAETHQMSWQLHDAASRVRTVVMVSQFGHCLNDLLFRWKTGTLPAHIVAVVSNHYDFGELAFSYNIPFRHIRVTPETKEAAEASLLQIIDEFGAELIVLARYMQIVSPELCRQFEGRMINIHHSFLPSFKGAKPYHQAHARGVKLVGASAHYVTPDLDEGPIIEQDVLRVDHGFSPERLAQAGRDVEAQVLARAVTWHGEHRVLLNGHKTVVFH